MQHKDGDTGAMGPKEIGDWGAQHGKEGGRIANDAPSQGVNRRVNPLMIFFDPQRYQNDPKKAEVAAQFKSLAYSLDRDIEDGAEKSTAMRKLIEAQDCIFRALDLNQTYDA